MNSSHYYVPEKSHWPIIGSIGLATTVVGAVFWLHQESYGPWVFVTGLGLIVFMMFGWFHAVIVESQQGLYNNQLDRSFRWGMVWFIFSEVMFFAAFFGALLYVRQFSVPWLGGLGTKLATHELLWSQFKPIWPLLVNPNPEQFVGPQHGMHASGIPAINTLLLLSSGVTITLAHHSLLKNKRRWLNFWLLATILLGFTFLSFQAYEYHLAYTHMGLTLNSGIYGTTFFMLTGFHGAHVTIGAIMLCIILARCVKGHFTPSHHFGFEATTWYWHFVDVVWLLLFVLVYWL